MKKIYSVFLLWLFSTPIFAETVDTRLSSSALGNQYFAQAKEAVKNKDFAKALKWFQESAKYNNAQANEILGTIYSATLPGVPIAKPDPDLAIKYMSRAAQLGDVEAKKMLISLQLKGFGNTPTEKIMALRSAMEASVLNSNVNKADNLLDLIDSYLNIKQKNLRSVSKAEYFANQSLKLQLDQDQKYRLSLFCGGISLAYLMGFCGVDPSPRQSFKWMAAAADLGLKNAYYDLSDMYFYGYGTPVSLKKSFEMATLGDKILWSRYDSDHKKHTFPFPQRAFLYLILSYSGAEN